MMSISQNHRGSALLVVLGMLAFMLFSGLAFSVYMRQSRLPTSFLRRATTTRQLAKAALAEAIEDLDKAIGNDPHPGLRTAGKSFDANAIDNFWSHRVFVGRGSTTNPEKNASGNGQNNSGNYYPALVSASETVPVLTLEGLAYLPPNLINEARYYSQRTPTAKWHSFWFDSGRYAYTAIDVSDYFDVNRMFADKPRATCGSRRITLAHLFETGYDHKGPINGAAEWDKFMELFRSVDDDDVITFDGGKCPLVSLADFNMAWGSQTLTFGGKSLVNPFYGFVENEQPYNCGESETDETADKYRMLTFVTDSWLLMPKAENEAEQLCNLEDGAYQPFKPEDLTQEGYRPSVREISTGGHKGAKRDQWFIGSQGQRLTVPDCAALWDYLDVDSVPVSLCMPTVERTPMVCGVRPYMAGAVKLEVDVVTAKKNENADEKPAKDGEQWRWSSCECTYKLNVSSLIAAQKAVQVLLTYPFQEHGITDMLDRNFKVDGRFSVFLTRADGDTKISVRPTEFSAYPKQKEDIKKSELTEKALLSFPIQERTVTPKMIVEGRNDNEGPCYKQDMKVESEFSAGEDLVLAKVTYLWPSAKFDKESGDYVVQHPDLDFSKEFVYNNRETTDVSGFTMYPLTTEGGLVSEDDLTKIFKGEDSFNLKANVAVWIRVRDENDYVVDMVPACHIDDQNMNKDSPDTSVQKIDGGIYPLLRTVATKSGDDELTYSLKALHGDGTKGALGSFTLPDTKLIVSDPRFNFASENWMRVSDGGDASGELKPEDWFKVASAHASGSGKDGDVFMSTSDAGYMQSIYELAFLPRMSNGFNDDDFDRGRLQYGAMSTTFGRADYATAFDGDNGPKDRDCMWRTYSPFGDDNDFYDLEALMASGSGTKVNPYSDSTKVLMAAFANTPHDWRKAATNENNEISAKLFEMDAATFNKDHAWNAYSSDSTGKTCYDCLEDFAAKFRAAVVAKAKEGGTWEDAYANMGWSTNKRKLLDSSEELEDDDADLYSVDKKFFYGFWHDCFAARQQLFLVFVRAEPMMMGGGVMGQTPPQLGARAVALVWRDPTPTRSSSQNNGGTGSANSFVPHRTRILFYHQFD